MEKLSKQERMGETSETSETSEIFCFRVGCKAVRAEFKDCNVTGC